MTPIPVTQLRRSRKKNSFVVSKKMLLHALLTVGVVFFILILPALPQSIVADAATLLALCTLILFAGIVVGLSIRLLMMLSNWMISRKHAMEEIRSSRLETASVTQAEPMVVDAPRLQKPFFRGLESVLSISAWAFFLNLMQPFITAIIWWQGYKLMEGRAFSLATIEATLGMIESSVYFGIVVFLILFSWSRWNYWRYGKLNRRKPKPLVSNTDLAVFFDVSLATVKEAQSVKLAHVVVGPGFVNFEKISLHDPKKIYIYAILSLLLCIPSPSIAASFSEPMSVLGYEQDVIVTGAKTNLSVAFPVPRITPLPGSAVTIIVEPGKNLNDMSNFTFYMNDRQLATFTAGQLRAKPNVQLPLSPDIINKGQAQVGIAANIFATNDICKDYERGYLFYTVRKSSALTMQFAPPAPKTIPEFFHTLTNGLLIILPDSPTLNEMASGAWAYGILQKQYPYIPIKLIAASERLQYPNLPRIWVGLLDHLPSALGGFTQGVHLPFPDALVITAEDDDNLQGFVKQLAHLTVMEAVPSANIQVSNQNQSISAPREKINFGNNTAQEGILSVPVDFEIYPAVLSVIPRSLNIHLEGRYAPSTIVGKQVRLDAFFNRKLIHSELLDASGVLNKDIIVPNSLDLKARNALSLVFEYPSEDGYCKAKGMVQSIQVLQSSYISGIDKFKANDFTWPNIGLLFNKKGLILLSDKMSPDIMRSAGEMVVLMNKQLPPGIFAYPSVSSTSEFSSVMRPDYLILLGSPYSIPEEFQKALPLQQGKDYTLYRGDGETLVYRHQSVGNTVLGQIGEYSGIPLISISASVQPWSLPAAIRKLQTIGDYNELAGNIFVVNEQNQISSFSNRPFHSDEEKFRSQWLSKIVQIWQNIFKFAESYRNPILGALGISILIAVGKVFFVSRKK